MPILNETSSTLTLSTVYWTSFKPLQIHELLPPLPHLEELHIYHSSSFVERHFYEEPPTAILFPQPLYLYISLAGDNPRKLSFSDELAKVAPNLTIFRSPLEVSQKEIIPFILVSRQIQFITLHRP